MLIPNTMRTPSLVGHVWQRTASPECSCHSAVEGDQFVPNWGFEGHGLVQELALESLPDELPTFFAENCERLVGLASQPDRWKARSLDYLRQATSIDHFMAYERVEGHKLPGDRYDFLTMVDRQGLSVPGMAPKWVGTLPYRVAEVYQNLTLDFALWRHAQSLPVDDPRREAAEDNVLMSAGLLGHYVGDAAQPLHSTVHHDGWNVALEPNPKGYRTRGGLHRQFESELVSRVADEDKVKERIQRPRRWRGDPLDWGLGLVAESNSQVETLYQLESEGELDPRRPGQQGTEFVLDRLAKGAENLRDLWYTAWLESEKLAREIRPPD